MAGAFPAPRGRGAKNMGTKKGKTSTESNEYEATVAEPAQELKRETRIELYAARRYLGLHTQQEFGLRMPVEVFFKDPDVAETYEGAGIDKKFTTPWEPGLRDGPTSARFAVVDYDSTKNVLTPSAVWKRKENCY